MNIHVYHHFTPGDCVALLLERINIMLPQVQELIDKVTEQTTQSAGLRVIVTQAVSELVALKTALTEALENTESLSDEDRAGLQTVIDNAGSDTALDAASSQELADAVAANAP